MGVFKKKNLLFLSLMISYILIYSFRLILAHVIGSKGVAFFSLPNETFFLFAGMFAYGIEEATASMIENRIARQQFSNVKRVAFVSFLFSLILGILFSVILLASNKFFIDSVFDLHLSYLSYSPILAAIPFMVCVGSLRGYFKGSNQRVIIMTSQIVFGIAYLVLGTLMSFVFLDYGNKVSMLLKYEDYSYSYGALGASLGVLIASIISFVHMVFMYFLFKSRTKYQGGRDYSKNLDYMPNIIINLAATSLFPTILYLVYAFGSYISLAFLSRNKEMEFSMEYSIGEYYGKVLPIIWVMIFVLAIFVFSNMRQSIRSMKREEYRTAREGLSKMIHKITTSAFFICVLVITLADNVLDILFASNGEHTVMYLQIGALLIVVAIYAIIFIEMIINMQNYVLAVAISLVAFIIKMIVCVILVISLKLSITGVIISDIIFFAVITTGGFLSISRGFQYTQEWFRTFVVTLISSLITGLIGMLLNKAIAPLTGKLISSLIILILSAILYIVVLLALKGYQEDELNGSAIGRAILGFGRLFNLI